MHDNVVEIFRNVYFWSGMLSWLAAQFTKMLCSFHQTRRLDFKYLASTGGMPSAHSAAVCGIASCLGIHHGFGSPIFSLALMFAIIVMFDASTVRRAAGLQARLLNEIVNELFKEHHLSERKLAELLGHTRLEVFMGMIMGILMSMLVTAAGIWLQPAA